MTMKVRKAVFPAAGLGTRFLPATKAQPKEMRQQNLGRLYSCQRNPQVLTKVADFG